jgi:hypothetical protein
MELSIDDRDKLLKALDHILEVLQIVVSEDLQEAVSSSYKKDDVDFIPLFKDSFSYTRDEIILARRQILNATSDLVKKLREHDLVDKSLEWKTQIIRIEHDNYLKERKHKKLPFLKRIIGKCLGGFDILLESLADCIPGLGAVTEFKKGIEHIIRTE